MRAVTTAMVVLTIGSGLLVGAALADKGELQQSISDLSSQTSDKQRLDTLGAARVELSQVRTWLTEAENAVKEDQEDLARRALERVRAQLTLVQELTALSQRERETQRLEQALANARRGLQSAKKKLDEKHVELRALKLTSR